MKNVFPRIIIAFLIALIILSILPSIIPSSADDKYFEIASYTFKSSANSYVYPGSKNARLIVDMVYTYTAANVSNVYACISLPIGFSVDTTACTVAKDQNGAALDTIGPSQLVRFTYIINVNNTIRPGNYTAKITLNYMVSGVMRNETHTLVLSVKPLPRIKITVIDSYLTPYNYPGSYPVSLAVELENEGPSYILYADTTAQLPVIMKPVKTRTQTTGIAPNERFNVVFDDLTISPEAESGIYYGLINISAQLRTPDGVIYNDSVLLNISFRIENAPPYNYTVLDYGLTTNYPSYQTRSTRFYLEIQSTDTSTLEVLVAKFKITNGFFLNGSQTSITYLNQPIRYGDIFTITSPHIDIAANASYVRIEIMFNALITSRGTEYWTNWSSIYLVRLTNISPSIVYVASYWSNQKAYPGSHDQTLNIILYNKEESEIADGYAVLKLNNRYFRPDTIVEDNVFSRANSYFTLSFNNIDVLNNTRPGNYTGRLELYLELRGNDGSYSDIQLNFSVIIRVSDTMIVPIRILDYEWATGTAYKGSVGAGIKITVQVEEDVTVTSASYKVIFPDGLISENTGKNYDVYATNNPVGYGEIFTVQFGNIEIHRKTSEYIVLALEESLKIDLDGADTWLHRVYPLILTIKEPVLNITVVDYDWDTRVSSREADNIGLHITFQSLSVDTIDHLIVRINLPNGLESSTGSNQVVETIRSPLNYLDVYTITVNGLRLNTNTDKLVVEIGLQGVLRKGNMIYNASRNFSMTLTLRKPVHPLVTMGIRVTYNGEPSPILPNSNGLIISYTLLNTFRQTIRSVRTIIDPPRGIYIIGSRDGYASNVPGGQIFTVSYPIRTGDLSPGNYTVKLYVYMILDDGGALIEANQTIKYRIQIDYPQKYSSRIIILSHYWGTTSPTQALPGEKKSVLTINFVNLGPYSVHGLRIRLKPRDESIKVLDNEQLCNTLAVSAQCSAVFHLDLENASPGYKEFTVYTSYLQEIYGSYNQINHTYNIAEYIPAYPGEINGSSLYLISSNWLNNWPVYPETKHAVYVVTLANLEPFTIGSIMLKLSLPDEMYKAYPNSLESYVAGPISSLQSFSTSFTMDIRTVQPGLYTGLLIISYYVYSGNEGTRKNIAIPVPIRISDPANAISVVRHGWIGGQPALSMHGAQYYLVIRDNEIPSMEGVVLRIQLPNGVKYSETNNSIAELTPRTIIPSQALSVPRGNIENQIIEFLIRQSQISQPVSLTVSKGDYLSFIAKLNLYLEKPLNDTINGTLIFVDHWGYNHELNISIPFTVFGRPYKIDIKPVSFVVVFRNGTGYIDLLVENHNSTPIYDVYVVLLPASMNAIPIDSIRYTPMIRGYSASKYRYVLVYNPASVSYGGYTISSLTAVFKVGLIYRDLTGSVNVYNSSIAATIKPFIELRLSPDTSAKYKDQTLQVSGLIINYGVTQARSVYVELKYKNYTATSFIGDIDPGSQSAFKVEIRNIKEELDFSGAHNITLILHYRDDYNSIYSEEYEIPVQKVVVPNTITTAPSRADYTLYYVVTIIMVGIFLVAVYYSLHRYFKKKTHI